VAATARNVESEGRPRATLRPVSQTDLRPQSALLHLRAVEALFLATLPLGPESRAAHTKDRAESWVLRRGAHMTDQVVTPYVLYRDVASALDWLSRALSFRETLRFTEDDGRVSHAEMEIDGSTIMLGQPAGDFHNPAELGVATVLLHIAVDDVDARFRRAVSAGAGVVREPADQSYGDRNCAVTDPEGHQWWLAQTLRDVAPEEWGATPASSSDSKPS
jgi:PhnB protein